MLVLVEGPDCAGKSTFVEHVASVLRGTLSDLNAVRVLHRGPPVDHPLNEYVLPLLGYRPSYGQRTQHVICDRWHLGELVYPAVLDRPTKLTPGVLRYVELFLRSRGALLVTITASATRLAECLDARGDDLVRAEQAEQLRVGFLDAEQTSGLDVINVLSDEVDDRVLPWHVKGDAEGLEHDATELSRFTTYVGPRWPKLLLLGDVRATGADPDDRRPAFMPYPATSGAWLLDALADDLRVDVGLANACDVDDPRRLWEVLGQPTTVALGRNAERTVPWADRIAPHPQWTRRFRHHERAEYRAQVLGLDA